MLSMITEKTVLAISVSVIIYSLTPANLISLKDNYYLVLIRFGLGVIDLSNSTLYENCTDIWCLFFRMYNVSDNEFY